MKIFRLFYVETEWIPSNVYDDNGYYDDYYDQYIDHEYTLGYFASKEAINKWTNKRVRDYGAIVDENEKRICYDEDLQFEEIEVIQ